MATVLSHGTGPEPDIYRSMYPISPPTNEGVDAHKPDQDLTPEEKNVSEIVELEEAAIPCLDGTIDQINRNHAQIRGPLTKACATTASANGTLSAFVVRQNSKSGEKETHKDDDNHDDSRRKRRKISSEHDSRESTPRVHLPKTSSLTSMNWLSGATATPESSETGRQSLRDLSPLAKEADRPLPGATTHTTSPRRSPRAKRTRKVDHSQQLGPSSASASTLASATESQPSKSNTKVLKASQRETNRSQSPSKTAPTAQIISSQSIADHRTGIKRNMKMKHGRLMQSLIVSLRYGKQSPDPSATGQVIKQILESKSKIAEKPSTKPHPFFQARSMQSATTQPAEAQLSIVTEATTEQRPAAKAPVAWSDIKFSNQRSGLLKSTELASSIWPPNWLQHIGRGQLLAETETLNGSKGAESKPQSILLHNDESILERFGTNMRDSSACSENSAPQRRLIYGQDAWRFVEAEFSADGHNNMTTALQPQIVHGFTAFDRGEAAGQQSWASKYAPSCWKDVFQPLAETLHDWLRALAVHNVQSGLSSVDMKQKEKQHRRRKRVKRVVDELDDFIVDDDDDLEQNRQITKNAILITGPSGCGKTASVFAVARELGFEVFEIHPGMRRSTKDIFDKVGDMTQNHLVQNHDNHSRSSSVVPTDQDPPDDLQIDVQQSSISTFLATQRNKPAVKSKLTEEGVSNRKDKKQSLILFEEVDILFEDDKGFWAGVQSLIQQSRRPVILTCNDVSRVPVEELDLCTVLEYRAPSEDLITEYLMKMAAAEGHLLQKQSLNALYASKGFDLRASITELNFWCQMTVGSKQGGLDWMISSIYDRLPPGPERAKLRICSEGTFTKGLDLMPEVDSCLEKRLQYAQDALEINITEWSDPKSTLSHIANTPHVNLKELSLWQSISDAQSALDSISSENVPLMVASVIRASQGSSLPTYRENFTATYVTQINQHEPKLCDFVDIFKPIAEEKPVFPPIQGRLAPSIDHENQAIALDIAPYVRSIVSFDKRTEQYREENFGSQGQKTRTTRAARAAAEGSDKANTRAERWFPKRLDFEEVLRTSNDWPEWTPDAKSGFASDTDMVCSDA